MSANEKPSNLILCARVREGKETEFGQWHARYQTAMLASPGAMSFEFWPPSVDQVEAVVVGRFASVDALRQWRHGAENRELITDAAPLVEGGLVMQLAGEAAIEYYVQHSATEVIITQIKAGKEEAYRAFADRIQKVQETFRGYLGSFVEPPHQKETGWTTVLRFNSLENLNGWLDSPQRAALLKESEDLIEGFHAQRVDTSFPGWAPTDPATGKPPNMWKTATLVLLTLFPVVMLELKISQSTSARAQSRVGHLHRQLDQRGTHDLAVDAACNSQLPRLDLPRKSTALARAYESRTSDRLLHRRACGAVAATHLDI